jgi:peptide methionine sulfoxide reductase MsrA
MNDGYVLGCFFKVGFDPTLSEQEFTDLADRFRAYIWGEKGICDTLKKLKHEDYGKDLKLALFQFYVRPSQIELQKLKEIEPYRKNEKSIGIPIVVTDENFFNESEEGRYNFLKESILQKLDLLAKVVKKKKLDTKMEQLKADLQKILNQNKVFNRNTK